MEAADRLARNLGLGNRTQSVEDLNVDLYRRIFVRLFGENFQSMLNA